MDNHYKEMIRFRLMEEISNINTRVQSLGRPRITAERSLIARYGKLLFVSQQLLDLLTESQLNELSGRGSQVAVQPAKVRRHGNATFNRRLGAA